MRWPWRRKDASPSVIPNAHPARRTESWRHLPRLVSPLTPSGPAVAHTLEFSRSIAAARPLTQREVPDHEHSHVPEPVGLVHLPVNVYTPAPVSFADDEAPIDEHAFELFPPRPRPRRLPTVARPQPERDLLRAPEIDLVALAHADGDDDEPRYQPPLPEPTPEPPTRTPREMRVFRPRRLGLGEPLTLDPLPAEPALDGPEDRGTDGHAPDERPRERRVEDQVDRARDELERADGSPPPKAMRKEAVPTDLRSTLSDALGVSVGDRPVYRGPEVSERARDLNARAFTYENDVFLPDELGPLSGTEARATLAHELTHVAQQRVLTRTLPDEGTDAGHRLETAAQSVERFVRGSPNAPRPTPELLHPDRTGDPDVLDPQEYADLVAEELARRGLAHRDAIGELVIGPDPSTLPSSSAPSGVQRQATATEEHTLGTRLGNLGDTLLGSLRADLGHTVLDEWNLDPRLHRQLDMDNETDLEERRQLRLINEHISQDNERRLARHEPPVAHVDSLTDAQRREIRAHVEQRLTEHDRATPPRTTSQPPSPSGHAPTTGAPGSHPAVAHTTTAPDAHTSGSNGEAHDLDTPLTGEQRRQNLRALGTRAGLELGEEYFALFGMREFGRDQLHEAAAPHAAAAGAAARGTTTPTAATHAGPHPSGAEALHPHTAAPASPPGAAHAGPAHAGPAAPAHGGAAPPVHAAHEAATSNFSELEDHQVEELVRRVYARLRTALRTELLVDRERAGMLADFR